MKSIALLLLFLAPSAFSTIIDPGQLLTEYRDPINCQDLAAARLVKSLRRDRLQLAYKVKTFMDIENSYASVKSHAKSYAYAARAFESVGITAGTAAGGLWIFDVFPLLPIPILGPMLGAFVQLPASISTAGGTGIVAAIPMMIGAGLAETPEKETTEFHRTLNGGLRSADDFQNTLVKAYDELPTVQKLMFSIHKKIDERADRVADLVAKRYSPAWFLSMGTSDIQAMDIERLRAQAHVRLYIKQFEMDESLANWAQEQCDQTAE